jgi:hypothetical protein
MALITKLSQISRCIGFSLILSTQRPDCNIIKGQLKNNLAIRIAFRCTSFHDSKIATGGHVGAEKLLSRQLLAIIPGSKPEIYTAPLKESEPLSLKRRTEALCLNEPIVVLPKLSTFHKEKENNNNNFHLQNSNLTFKEVPSTIERLDGYVPPHKLFNKTANLKYRPTYILKNKWWKYVAIDLNTGRLLSNTRFSRAHLHALWNLSESYWRVINDVQSTGTCRNTKDITTAWKCVQLGLLKVADCDDNFLLSPDLQSPPSIFLAKHVASSIPVSKKIAKAIQNTRVAIARLWKQNRSTELVLGLPYLLSASGYVPAWKVKSKLVLAKESTDV